MPGVQISPMPPQPPTSSIENENVISQSSRRRLSVFGNSTKLSSPNPSSTQLNVEKFEQALAPDFISGFEETEECFTRITTRAALLLGAEKCFVFIKDNNEQQLYTFLKDIDGNKVIVVKPINRGITGTILADPIGFNENNIGQCQRWVHEVDELPNFVTTCYLAWPIWDFAACKSIGVLEFRNKLNGLLEFNAADSQLARIIALQLSHGFIHYKQQKLIHGRNEAINQAYEKNYDLAETIELASSPELAAAETLALIETGNKNSRRPYTTARQPSPSLFDIRRSSVSIVDKAWDYDVFVKSDEELMMHAIDIFDERGLFSRFSIPITTFVNFVNEVKNGYDSNAPYHNSYHAFDVMHVCYLLLTMCGADEYLESFNVLSILVAALAHDLGHDGYNNSFHQSTGSDLALTYNGISVQENYSASYLFRILRKPECNIFARLNDEEMSKMRTRLIDMILDTDAKNHFMLMTRFKHALELKKLSRGLLSSMILHVADVSNPTRPGKVSRKWAYVVQSEFFRQGDKEKELNMKRSPFMDREFENLPRMQVAFIDAVVQPVFKLFSDFLPLVEGQCLKPLLQNREFWQSMLHRTTIKTDEIKVFLDNEKKEDSDVDESNDDGNSIKSGEYDAAVEPIPGIPADATKDSSPLRRMSVISLNADTKRLFDPEVGIKFDDKKLISVHNFNQGVFQAIQNGMKMALTSTVFQTLAFVATIYGLFASDLNSALGNKEGDFAMDVTTLVVLIVFVFELLMSLVCVPTYFHFFFWLDLVATISCTLR